MSTTTKTKRRGDGDLKSATKRRQLAHASADEERDHQMPTKALGSLPGLGTRLSRYRVEEIADGEVYHIPNFVSEETAKEWYEELEKLDTWYHPTLKVYGKPVTQSRSIAAYATDPSLPGRIKYSGHVVDVQIAYPPLLAVIQRRVETSLLGDAALTAERTTGGGGGAHGGSAKEDEGADGEGVEGVEFNHVMLNRYADGMEYIGRHRDTKENKIIASLSLGAERTFIMSPAKPGTETGAHKWVLKSGSLLVMAGRTQERWRHEIPKEPKVKDGRISLTFRQLVFG